DDERPLRLLQRLEERTVATGDVLQRLGSRAKGFIVVAQIAELADHADRQRAGAETLADTGIEHRSLETRIGADDEDRIGILDPLDRRVEDIARATERRVERGAILTAIDIGRAKRSDEALQRIHFLDGGQIAGNRAD